MNMQLFYLPTLNEHSNLLDGEEARHIIKVLRNKVGDKFMLTNGIGALATVKITLIKKEELTFEIEKIEHHSPTRNYYLHVAIAPTKNMDRLEWFVEKAVELGIDEMSFLLCEKSERKILKTERILKITESAMKQSLQSFLPKVNDLITFSEFLEKKYDHYDAKFIAHCESNSKVSITDIKKKQRILILIGPEGDFSKREIEKAEKLNWKGLDLGTSRLRTETAALAVVNYFKYF
jgi:16S rRNA (uracil1498-N3)-methyltransferase